MDNFINVEKLRKDPSIINDSFYCKKEKVNTIVCDVNSAFKQEEIDKYISLFKKAGFKDGSIHFCYSLPSFKEISTNGCKKLSVVDKYLKEKYNMPLYLKDESEDNSFTFEAVLNANKKLDKVANNIKNAITHINYKEEPLSTFEKFMMVYEYVTNFAYGDVSDADKKLESRHYIPILNGDKIVCAGYASLLKELCERIFDEEELKCFIQHPIIIDKENNIEYHANNLIYLKDEKYGIDALFYADACFDSINCFYQKTYGYCLLPIQDILYDNAYKYVFNYDEIINLYLYQFPKYSSISLDKNSAMKKQSMPIEDIFENMFIKKQFNNDTISYFKKLFTGTKNYNYEERISEQEQNKYLLDKMEYYSKCLEKCKKYDIPLIFNAPCIVLDDPRVKSMIDSIYKSSPREKIQTINRLIDILEKSSGYLEESLRECKSHHGKTINLKDYLENIICKYEMEKAPTLPLSTLKIKEENAKKALGKMKELCERSVVPIEAYINAYKIIAEKEKVSSKRLRSYLDKRILPSLNFAKESFETKKCKNCFATTKLSEYEQTRKIII